MGLLSYFGGLDLDKEPEDIITDATVNCRKNSDHKTGCEENKQCHWLQSGKCIHQTERLYNALYKKLNKRGKKDFAIQVFYHGRLAKIKLPHGLYGPHITGAFNYIKGLQPYYKPIGYNSYLNTYGLGGYNHHGYGHAHGFGHRGYGYGKGGYEHGYGGYGYGKGGYGQNNGGYDYGNGGYGHDNGGSGYDNGEVRNNGTSDNDNGDYGHGNGEYGHDNGGYGYGNGGYGHGNGGYGGGHSHTEYSGPSYGYQGHSAG